MRKILCVLLLLALPALPVTAAGLFGDITSVFGFGGETFGVGEEAEIGGCCVTLADVMESKGNSSSKPEDGNIYVICRFSIRNGTDEDLWLSTLMNFGASFDGKKQTISVDALAVAMLNGLYQLDGAVEAGSTRNGVVAYEVPADWSEMRIDFSPEIMGPFASFEAKK